MSDIDKDIPTRRDVDSKVERGISESLYNSYYRPYLEFLYNVDRLVGKEEVLSKAKKDVSSDTKERHLKSLFEYNPYLSLLVAGAQPRAVTFVDLAIDKYDINISSGTINEVQKRCVELRNKMYRNTLDYFINNAVSEVYERMGIGEDDLFVLSKERHKEILNRYGIYFAKELPSKLESFNQSMTKIGGDANEIIILKALMDTGLTEGTHFNDISSQEGSEGNPGDLRVFTTRPDVDAINVEVKSEKSRERGGAGIARLDSPTILFGYFDDKSELLGNYEELIEGCIAVYAPPTTLNRMKHEKFRRQTRTGNTTREDEWLFFRNNTRFAGDMKAYYRHGRLPRRPTRDMEDAMSLSDLDL